LVVKEIREQFGPLPLIELELPHEEGPAEDQPTEWSVVALDRIEERDGWIVAVFDDSPAREWSLMEVNCETIARVRVIDRHAASLPKDELPNGFAYPPQFLGAVASGLRQFEPWHLLTGASLLDRRKGLRDRYAARTLVPFARRHDNDDACWDVIQGNLAIVHDYADPGFEQRDPFTDFIAWLHRVVDDFADFHFLISRSGSRSPSGCCFAR
jgi:hypothetical protein